MDTEDDAPRASMYLRMLWGFDGSRLGQPEPEPPKEPNPRQHFIAGGKAKFGFPSRWHAGRGIEHTKAKPGYRPPPPGVMIHAYKCEICHKWHIGHKRIEA